MKNIDAPRFHTFLIPTRRELSTAKVREHLPHHPLRDLGIATTLAVLATLATAQLREGPFNGPKVDPVYDPSRMDGIALVTQEHALEPGVVVEIKPMNQEVQVQNQAQIVV